MFMGDSDRLVPSHRNTFLRVTVPQEVKAVKLFSICIYLFVCVDSTLRKGQRGIRRDGYAIGKREGA